MYQTQVFQNILVSALFCAPMWVKKTTFCTLQLSKKLYFVHSNFQKKINGCTQARRVEKQITTTYHGQEACVQCVRRDQQAMPTQHNLAAIQTGWLSL